MLCSTVIVDKKIIAKMKQTTISTYEQLHHRRLTDRRNQSVKAFFYSLYKGRRSKARRQYETDRPFYTDIYETRVGLNVITIVCLSALDSFFTLQILERGGIEINPIMLSLLEINSTAFIVGKMAITSICLLFVLVHINFKILRLFPMRSFLFSIASFYVLLIGYEITLLSTI